MADYGWMTLKIWPWDDRWLDQDPELAEAFDEVGLLDYQHGAMGEEIARVLQPASEGEFLLEDGKPAPGGGPEFKIATLTGKMQGSSYAILDSDLLQALQERNIAFALWGDAAWNWDGDETWWHPGRDEWFQSSAGEGGRFLNHEDFRALRMRCLSVAKRVGLLNTFIEESGWKIETAEAEDRNRVAAGEAPIGEHIIQIHKESIANHLIEMSRLLDERSEPEDLGELVSAWFAADPLAWRPDADWAPNLQLEEAQDGEAV